MRRTNTELPKRLLRSPFPVCNHGDVGVGQRYGYSGLDVGSEGGAARNIVLQQRKCKFGKRCKYPYCPFWHEIPARIHHSRGSVKDPNDDCSGHGVPCTNYFEPLNSIFDGKDGGGPQRTVWASGQRRSPHRSIHTYPPGANSCNPVLHSERTHTHTHNTHTHTHTNTHTHTHTHTHTLTHSLCNQA